MAVPYNRIFVSIFIHTCICVPLFLVCQLDTEHDCNGWIVLIVFFNRSEVAQCKCQFIICILYLYMVWIWFIPLPIFMICCNLLSITHTSCSIIGKCNHIFSSVFNSLLEFICDHCSIEHRQIFRRNPEFIPECSVSAFIVSDFSTAKTILEIMQIWFHRYHLIKGFFFFNWLFLCNGVRSICLAVLNNQIVLNCPSFTSRHYIITIHICAIVVYIDLA